MKFIADDDETTLREILSILRKPPTHANYVKAKIGVMSILANIEYFGKEAPHIPAKVRQLSSAEKALAYPERLA